MTNIAYITQKTGVLNTSAGPTLGLCHCRRSRSVHFARFRRSQKQCNENDDNTLTESEPEERRLVSAALDHIGYWNHGKGGARAETRCGQTRRKTAPIGKPLQGIADRAAIDDACADPADRGTDVE